MKTTINILIALCFVIMSSCKQSQQQQQATTNDGKKVILYDDGTWKYTDGSKITNLLEDGGNKFIGKWKAISDNAGANISKNGDYYQWDGYNLGNYQFKYKDEELQSSDGNVTYNKSNGHIYFKGLEFSKVQ